MALRASSVQPTSRLSRASRVACQLWSSAWGGWLCARVFFQSWWIPPFFFVVRWVFPLFDFLIWCDSCLRVCGDVMELRLEMCVFVGDEDVYLFKVWKLSFNVKITASTRGAQLEKPKRGHFCRNGWRDLWMYITFSNEVSLWIKRLTNITKFQVGVVVAEGATGRGGGGRAR